MKSQGAATLLALGLAVSGCSSATTSIEASGRVDTDAVVVAAPRIVVPAADLNAGFAPDAMPEQGQSPVRASAAPHMRLIWVKPVGSQVATGDLVARFDAAALRAGVVKARAERAMARAQVGVIDDNLATVADNRANALDTQAMIRDKLAQAKKMRPVLVKNLRELKATLASIPDIPQTAEQRAKLKAAIAKLSAALRQLDAGVAKAKAGLAKLSDGLGKLTDAKDSLDGVRDTVVAQAPAADAALTLARWQLGQARVTAPEAGILESAANPGEVLAPGATVATIRSSGPATATVWISPENSARVCLGDKVALTADWAQRELAGSVSAIGARADYPPTRQTTTDIHLTRAVPITITADQTLPAGAPIDVALTICTRSTS
jgi:X-X-X-Leu-X-X-Gly heptad repeat protein